MRAVLWGSLRVVVGGVISLAMVLVLFTVLARVGTAVGLPPPGAPELMLTSVVAIAIAWVAVRRIAALWPTHTPADEVADH